MKRFLGVVGIFVALFLVQVALPQFAQAQVATTTVATSTPKITVVTPNGGEEYKLGTTIPVTWKSENVVGGVVVDIGTPDFSRLLISDSQLKNTGKYNFPISKTTPVGKYSVRIRAVGASDTSDRYFTIVATSTATSTPLPIVIATSTVPNVTFTSNGNDLQISKVVDQNGATKEAHLYGVFNIKIKNGPESDVAFGTPGTAFAVTLIKNGVPYTALRSATSSATTTYYPSTQPTGVTKYSANGFTVPKNKEIVIPITYKLDTWGEGGTMLDLPSGSYSLALEKIVYGKAPSTLGYVQSFSGVAMWRTPERARSIGNSANNLDAPTRLVSNVPNVSVRYPNGGERLYVGSSYSLSWKSGAIDTTKNIVVKITDTRKDGKSATIATVPATSNSYTWTIPESIGDLNLKDWGAAIYRLSVSVEGSSTITDVSDNNFAIVYTTPSKTDAVPVQIEPVIQTTVPVPSYTVSPTYTISPTNTATPTNSPTGSPVSRYGTTNTAKVIDIPGLFDYLANVFSTIF